MPKFARLATAAALTIASIAVTSPASAAPIVFSAGDAGASTRAMLINSTAAQAAFIAATPSASTLTFDGANPAGVTVSGGGVATSCGGSGDLFGFNTTVAGANFLCLGSGGSATFTFSVPIDSFGLFITGLQSTVVTHETLTFSDGSSQTLAPVSIASGGAFLGFTDAGHLIASVTYNASNDIVGLDDIRFGLAGASQVPEPESLALFGIALVALAAVRRRR